MTSIPRPLSRLALLEMLGDPSRRRSLGGLLATGVDLSSDAIERELEWLVRGRRPNIEEGHDDDNFLGSRRLAAGAHATSSRSTPLARLSIAFGAPNLLAVTD